MGFNIAIDGPAGAGKSTAAKRVAAALSFIYVDTGAMYRAIGLHMLNHNIELQDEEAVSRELPALRIRIGYENGIQQVYLNGQNVSDLIRTQEVGEAASVTSRYAPVRAKLLELQRALAAENDVLIDGRDIGTAVLPHADLKIYLTASSYVRAKRRFDEYREKGQEADLAAIQAQIEERDYRDMNRENAPLRQAEDALLLDTSDMDLDTVVETIIRMVQEKRTA